MESPIDAGRPAWLNLAQWVGTAPFFLVEHPMRSTYLAAVAWGLLIVACAARAAETKSDQAYQPRYDKDGWEILFDGSSLDAWAPPAPGTWAVNHQGELFPAKAGRSLFTKQRYCDFVLEADFKLGAKRKANSGVFIRVHNCKDEVNTGMEIQILDNGDYGVPYDAGNANGALYDLVHPAVDANRPIGQWNHYRITANDNLIVVELNGQEIVRADLNRWTTAHQNPDGAHNKFPHAIGSLPREGFVGLQNYGGTPVWFRNVRIKTLTDRKPQQTGQEPIDQVLKK
jgi:hypothetical protein